MEDETSFLGPPNTGATTWIPDFQVDTGDTLDTISPGCWMPHSLEVEIVTQYYINIDIDILILT